MTAIPSREFMIQQAVLNAAVIWHEPLDGRVPGYLAKMIGVPQTLRCLISGDFVRQSLVDLIRAEFCAIAHSYGIMVL